MKQPEILVRLTTLKKINENSYRKGYNRTICYDYFLKNFKKEMKSDPSLKWRGEAKNFALLEFVMFHKWKKGVSCDTHIRALVCNGTYDNCGLFIDLDIDTWERLEMTSENVRLNRYLNEPSEVYL
jgi:hypothetical protein